jgi:hypothetical protein
MYTHVECKHCRETMEIDDTTEYRQLVHLRNLSEILSAGEEVPAGRCKACESLVYVVKDLDPVVLSARFAQLLMTLKDLYDITWSDVALEARMKPEEVLEFMKAAKTMWDKVRWIYDNQGVENVLTDKGSGQ